MTMNKKFIACLLLSGLIMTPLTQAASTTSHTVQSYDVNVNKNLYVPYKTSSELFKEGFVTGFGSGITFKGYDSNGNPQFYAITDRGPNADAPKYTSDDETKEAKIFPAADFTPSIGIVTLQDNKAVIDSSIQIKNSAGKKITGLPLENGLVGSTGEVALDENLNPLGYDVDGLDPEGIAVDRDGNFWICDEYGPFLLKLDPNGKILEKYAPGSGLPEVLKYRIPNRGFEGLTISPSGKIFVALQSVLDIEGKTSKTASFTRIVEFDPATKNVKTYAYPINVNDYKSPKACKIGDIYAISDTKLLVIEQGTLKDGSMRNMIYTLDLSNASDITHATVDGKELEYVSDPALLKNYKFGSKSALVDLRAEGWTAEKAEGICLLDDKQTIVVVNDNDFGLTTNLTDPILKDTDITDYTYNAQDKSFTYTGTVTPTINIQQNTQPAQIWTIKLPAPIQ